MSDAQSVESLPLAAYLKESTRDRHDRLDQRIMQYDPFADRERFALFVRVQHRLHQITSPLFNNPELQKLLPELLNRDRLQAVIRDAADLGITEAELQEDRQWATRIAPIDAYTSLGWLYADEGSNLGAAILLQHARKSLELSETFGARHLAGHADGRASHWRAFKADLDALELTEQQRQYAAEGARQAFDYVREAVEDLLGKARSEEGVATV